MDLLQLALLIIVGIIALFIIVRFVRGCLLPIIIIVLLAAGAYFIARALGCLA